MPCCGWATTIAIFYHNAAGKSIDLGAAGGLPAGARERAGTLPNGIALRAGLKNEVIILSHCRANARTVYSLERVKITVKVRTRRPIPAADITL